MSEFNKKGKVNQELATLLILIIIILVIIIVCSLTSYNKIINESNPQNVKLVYNNILSQIRYDTRYALSAVIATDSLILLDKNSQQICKYELKDSNLLRTDKNNKISTLFKNAESVSFTSNKDLSNLLTIRIYPSNKSEIPFFTSFALRGTEQ